MLRRLRRERWPPDALAAIQQAHAVEPDEDVRRRPDGLLRDHPDDDADN